jgi:lipoprotein-releasing system permease protein
VEGLDDFAAAAERVAAVPGTRRVAPLVRGQVMASAGGRNVGVEVFGIRPGDLATLPRIADPETMQGDMAAFPTGIAIGVGGTLRLISPDGARTAFGTTPRISAYEVAVVFEAGRYDIDRTRVYMPFEEAQVFFNRQGAADELEVMVEDPEEIDAAVPAILAAAGDGTLAWTWRDASGAFLRALDIEDNVMFVIMSVLVLVAAMNIVSGLVMLVKNKGRDIGILRTMGLTEGAILRVFFLCGALTGLVGTALGVLLGCAFVIWIDPIFGLVDRLSGGGVWDPSVRGIYALPALLRVEDVLSAVALSLGLSFLVTLPPARRAARMNPVEALRYE